MNRRVAASLAVVATGAGLVWSQAGRAVADDPTPPPSVIRADGTLPYPRKLAPLPAISPYAQTAESDNSKPPPSVVRVQDLKAQPATPEKQPPSTPAVPLQPAEKPVEKPAEKLPEIITVPPEPSAVKVVADGESPLPSYATRFFEPAMPWTKCGRRYCGTVYLDTPYFWLDTDFTYSWIKRDHTVPLVTAGAANAARPGALDDPGTTVLFSGQDLQHEPYYGGKFSIGAWLDECQYFGMEAGYIFLAARDRGFIASANGNPGTDGLFIPFFNPTSGVEDAFAVATGPPNQASGMVEITSRTRVQGADGHFLFSFARGLNFRCDAIAGVRWLGLDEDLIVQENIVQQPIPAVPVKTSTGIYDGFSTRNDFIGADFGFKTRVQRDCWSFDLITRIAAGGTHEQIRNNAFAFLTAPGFSGQTSSLGRLITSTNTGEFSNDFFSVVPEVGATIGWQPKNWCRFTLGYTWTYWTDVLRVGETVDHVVNPVGVPTNSAFNASADLVPRRPAITFSQSDMWIQSVSLGVQFMY